MNDVLFRPKIMSNKYGALRCTANLRLNRMVYFNAAENVSIKGMQDR